MKFSKVKDGIMFTHEGDFTDFKNSSGEVIGVSKTTQTVKFQEVDKGLKMLEDNLEHVKTEIEKYESQLSKITVDTTPFLEFGKFCERNKDKVPLHKFKKLESIASLMESKNSAEKMLEYLRKEKSKIEDQMKQYKKVM